MPLTFDPVLTPEQTGEMIHRPTKQVTKMCREGILPGFKRSKRLWGIRLSELEKWLSSRGQKAVSERQAAPQYESDEGGF